MCTNLVKVQAPALFVIDAPVEIECGAALEQVSVAYRTWGRLSPAADNAVAVCHALTGSADADLWWGDLIGPGNALDPDRHFIVCSNVLGSCYGTTGPMSPRPGTASSWGPDFPPITIRDMVAVQQRLLDGLGARRIRLVMVLKPLADAFGVEAVHVTTLQAVSGAGYPGLAALDILGDAVPMIPGEEEKLCTEPQKILGHLDGHRIDPARLQNLRGPAFFTSSPASDSNCSKLSWKRTASSRALRS